MTKTLERLYNELFDLRNKQANCTVNERALIQAEIKEVLRQIDLLEKGV